MLKRRQISLWLIVLLVLLSIVIGSIHRLAPTIDISEYRAEIFNRLDRILLRKFSIDGKLDLKISFKPTLVTQNLTIENPEWSKTPYFIKSAEVEIGIDIIDLLFGKTTIDRLILSDADIYLEQNQSGQANWQFGQPKKLSDEKTAGNVIRLDYVLLNNVRLNYLSPKLKNDVNISQASLKRSLRGRYRIELDSVLSGKNFTVSMLSNRWFDFPNFRPLKLKLDMTYGKSQIQSNIEVGQINPGLIANIDIESSNIKMDELLRQIPSKNTNSKNNKTSKVAVQKNWLHYIQDVTLNISIDNLRKGHHVFDGVVLQGKLLHDKSWAREDFYVNLKGDVGKITNTKDVRQNLFGFTQNATAGQLSFAMSGKGGSLEQLFNQSVLDLTAKNISANKPYPYVIKNMTVGMDDNKRLRFEGAGNYRNEPISFTGRTGKGTLLKLYKDETLQVNMNFSVGKSRTNIYAALESIFKPNKNLQIRVNGTNLGELSPIYGKRLPALSEYILESRMRLLTNGIKSSYISLRTPVSYLAGKYFYHYGRPATLNLQLANSHLTMTDLQRELKKELPDKKNIVKSTDDENDSVKVSPSVRVVPDMDMLSFLSPKIRMNVSVDNSNVSFNKFTVTDLKLKTRWENNVFATEITKGRVAGGNLTSDIYLTVVDNEAAGKMEMDIKHLNYGQLMQSMTFGDKMKGMADVNIHLVGFGRSLREFLTRSDGTAEFVGEKGILASRYLKLWGEDIVQQILPFNWFDSEQTGLNCVVGRFDLTDGRLSSDSLLIDTEGMTIAGTGAIDLKTEELAFELMPDPKKLSLVSLATPVKIRGTLARPRIEPHTLGTTWTIGSLLAGLANPSILIARFAKLGSLGENPCLAAIGKKEGEEEETSILKMFKDAVKFIQRPLDKMPDLE